MGLGAYPASDPKFLGMLGMHGTYEANMTMQHCDVLLAVGARFDDRVIGNPKHFASVERKIVHVDIDPSSISKRVRVDVPIVGDVKDVLADLTALLRESASRPDVKTLSPPGGRRSTSGGSATAWPTTARAPAIKPQHVVETLCELTRGGETYITSDVGQHQMWAAQYYRFEEPRRWINSGGSAPWASACPTPWASSSPSPAPTVVCITGEGSIQMCIQELSTCLQYKTPVKIVSLNNRYLGMVRQWQQIDYGSRYSHSYMEALPDFVKLAEAYGHVGIRIDKPSEVEPALREALRAQGSHRVPRRADRSRPENVWPMVKAGQGISEMLLGSEDL